MTIILMTATMDDDQNEIIILKEGYSRASRSDSDVQHACGTSTLIKTSDGRYILVDTLGPWERDELIQLLRSKAGIEPSQVSMVIGTHHHVDHIGNLNLFPHVEVMIVGNDKILGDRYQTIEEFETGRVMKLTPEVEIRSTPGHTSCCVSVVVEYVRDLGTVAIVGDLFENEADLSNEDIWINAGSQDPEQQREWRSFMMQDDFIDYIVPGHGPMFKVQTDPFRLLND